MDFSMIKLDKFIPRSYQIPFFEAMENSNKYRAAIFVGPRRLGKDYMAWNFAIRWALRKTTTVLYFLPQFRQARSVIWDAISNDGTRFLDLIPPELIKSMNATELKITLMNNSVIQLRGSDKYDTSVVGSNATLIIFSEFSRADYRAFEFASPIVAANGGKIVFISTPLGRNHFYDLWERAKQWPDWWRYRITVDDTKHITQEALDKERLIHSEEFIQQEYYCFPAGQQVLTDRESKSIEMICRDDLVVSHSGRLRKVLDVISREYEGDLIEISSFGSGENIICTPNHPLRIYHSSTQSYEWKEARKITEDDRVVFPKMTLGEYPVISHELCMLLAWYITEGSCMNNAAQFSIIHDEAPIIIEYLKSLGLPYAISVTDSMSVVQVNSVQLADFFKSSCGLMANNKRIPFHLISSHEEDFFHELMKGDGSHGIHKNQERFIYSTVSKTLAYQVQLLANSLNLVYAAGISIRDACQGIIDGRSINCQKSYQVHISFSGIRVKNQETQLIRAKNCIAARIRSIDTYKFKGLVYNLSVQYDESYLINGRSVHNCSWDRGVEGSFYANYVLAMRNDGRIGKVPYDPSLPVFTAWDLGFNDQTVIVFGQLTKNNLVHVIDSYANTNQPLNHYIKVIQSKEYVYSKHFGPHDIEIHDYQTGHTRIEMARQLGLNFEVRENKGKMVSATPRVSVADGIEKVMASFSRIYIDEQKCAKLIVALESYHREWDDGKKIYKQQPYHDQHSDWCDSFRYMCLTLDQHQQGMTEEDARRGYNKVMYGSEQGFDNPFTSSNPFSGTGNKFNGRMF